MATTDIGRAVPLLRGEYDPAQTYELNDIVSLNGSLYWHYSHEVTTNVAPQATSTWKIVLSLTDAEAYIARAETAAEEAESAKDDAVTAKTAAETASTTATGASEAATAAKDDAVTARNAAQTAETGAVEAKNAAVSAKEAAQSAASSAGTSATNASNSAGTAEYYAENAETAAETATTKASEASASATTASSAATTATEAKNTAVSSASTATTKAGEASTSATSAASSAAAAQAVKDSIPEDYSELSEDVSDLKTQIENSIGVADTVITSLADYTPTRGVINSSNVWANITGTGAPCRHIVVPIARAGGNFSFTPPSGRTGYYAFLTDYAVPTENGEVPAFCASPYNTRKAKSGEPVSDIIPDDAAYMYIAMITDSGTDISPDAISIEIPGVDGDLTRKVEQNEDDIEALSGSVDDLSDTVHDALAADPSSHITSLGDYTPTRGLISTYNVWSNITGTGAPCRHIAVPIERAGGSFSITAQTGHTAYYAFLTDYAVPTANDEVPDFCAAPYNTRKVLQGGETDSGTVPEDAAYMYIAMITGSGTDISPETISIEIPGFVGYVTKAVARHENAIKKAETTINIVESVYNHGGYVSSKGEYSEYYKGLQNSYTGLGYNSLYSDVIAAFDALMNSYPDYITKNALGMASGTDAGGNDYVIYEYVFSPKQKTNALNNKKIARIYMDGSIHGFEKCSTYGIYYFLKDICENWDKNSTLENMRAFIEFHIIPVSNPWGFDNKQYNNANNVNINRNFDAENWEPVVDPEKPGNNTGSEPFDQPESAIIRDWIIAGKDDILMYFNCHTNGVVTTGVSAMNDCVARGDLNDEYFNKIFAVFCKHIDKQTVIIPRMYPQVTLSADEMCGSIAVRTANSVKKGTASAWAAVYQNVIAMTLETFNKLVDDNNTTIIDSFSSDALKLNSEIIGNMVGQIVSEYSAV